MKIVTYSVVLNLHQAPVADELWELTGHEFVFVELINLGDAKGGREDYSQRPYLLRAWESNETHAKAMELAKTAECCIFSGVESLPYQKERMKLGLFSFEMGERWLKHGWKSLASPRLLKWLYAYYMGGWKHKPLYKLCMSAFAAQDHYRMKTFIGKAYKWGYFTVVDRNFDVEASTMDISTPEITPLMWCSRFLVLKHPELPILMAKKLREKGYHFILDMYGDGEKIGMSKKLIHDLKLDGVVSLKGSMPNTEVLQAMRSHDIFLFTSDRYEGWGAVANESMANGCVLVASNAIGSAPYLIEDGDNGFTFNSASPSTSFDNPDWEVVDELAEKVEWLLNHRKQMHEMQEKAVCTMQTLWNPHNAVQNLLHLIDELKHGRETSILYGPCSKA